MILVNDKKPRLSSVALAKEDAILSFSAYSPVGKLSRYLVIKVLTITAGIASLSGAIPAVPTSGRLKVAIVIFSVNSFY